MKKGMPVNAFLLFAMMMCAAAVAVAQSTAGPAVTLTDPGPVGAATTTAIFAHFAVGGGYTTVFTLVNTGGDSTDGNLILTAQNGGPFNAGLQSSDGTSATGSSIHVLIPPGGTTIVTASPAVAGDPATRAGWGRVESSGGTPGGVSTFQVTSGGALQTVAGVLSSNLVSSATIPVSDIAGSRFTGYAVANPGSTSISIKVVEVDANGNPVATLSPVSLGPGAQVAQFFFQDPAANPNFTGSAVLIGQSGATFAVVALVQVQGVSGPLFTAIPVIQGKAPNIN